MDYKKLIDKKLVYLFKKVHSLTIPATFHLKSGEGFNFSTAAPTKTAVDDKTVQVLVIKTSQKQDTVRKEILLDRIDDLEIYDSVTLGGQTWKLGGVLIDYEFIQIIEVYDG